MDAVGLYDGPTARASSQRICLCKLVPYQSSNRTGILMRLTTRTWTAWPVASPRCCTLIFIVILLDFSTTVIFKVIELGYQFKQLLAERVAAQ